MSSNTTFAKGIASPVIVTLALLIAGCSTPLPLQEPVAEEPIVVLPPVEPPAEPEPEPVVIIPVIPEPAALPAVAIVLSSNQPAYADVASELTRRFENYELYDLSDESQPPVTALRRINDSESSAVVAIGLRAARSSVAMSDKPVVFSQVFNYQDHGLLRANSRGVASIAPLEAQVEAWKSADPTIGRVGVIIGEGHEDLIAEATAIAERHGIELRVQVTRSDQETLYFFKRMVLDIDGFWLLPDNRVLSRRALNQIMIDTQRHGVAVLVPNESMLQAGASVSVSSVASDIAATIVKVVRQIQAGDIAKVPPITQLSEARVVTREAIQVVER